MLQWGVSFLTKRRAVRIFPADLHMSVPLPDVCSGPEPALNSQELHDQKTRMRA